MKRFLGSTFALAAATAALACSSGSTEHQGGGGSTTTSHGGGGSGGSTGGAGGCADVSGAFIVAATASCTPSSYYPPVAACIAQQGCDITLMSSVGTISGTVSGKQITAEGPIQVSGVTVQYSCTGTVDGSTASLSCSAAGVTCTIPGDKVASSAGVEGYCCDPVHSECAATAHCTYTVPDTTSGQWFTTCVTASGSGKAGDACTKTDYGFDDCGPGLLCASFGFVKGENHCLPLCTKAGDCPANQNCADLGGLHPGGACVGACALFGTDCEAGTTCRAVNILDAAGKYAGAAGTFCNTAGAGALGATCTYNSDCGSDAVCDGDQTCRALCDAAHPCASGTCTPLGYGAPNDGVGDCH